MVTLYSRSATDVRGMQIADGAILDPTAPHSAGGPGWYMPGWIDYDQAAGMRTETVALPDKRITAGD